MKKLNIFLLCSFILSISYAQNFKLNGNFEWAALVAGGWKVVDVKPTYEGGFANNKTWGIGLLGSALYSAYPEPTFSVPPDGDINNKKVAAFYNGGTSETDSWLISPKVDSIAEGDYLCFWLDNSNGGYRYNLDVLISVTNDSLTSFKDTIISFKEETNQHMSWKFFTLSLAKYIKKNIYIAFRTYKEGDYDGSIQVDNITVGISSMPNLEFVQLLSPENPLQNVTDSVEISAVIKNLGSKVEEFDMYYKKASAHSYDYTGHHKFYRTIEPLDTIHVTFPAREFFELGKRDTLSVYVVYSNDVDHSNDTINTLVDNVIPGAIPYTNGFETTEEIAGIKFYNTMRDESKWTDDLNSAAVARKGNGCMRYTGNPNTDADDWFFSKLIYLSTQTYQIKFWIGTTDEYQPQKLQVKWTTAQRLHTDFEKWYLYRNNNITNKVPQNELETRGFIEADARFTVETPGYYYIGFHCNSSKCTQQIAELILDDLSINIAADIDEPENIDIMVFPNPANDNVCIQGNYPIKKIDVFNMLGQKVITQNFNTRYAVLNTNTLNEGIYFLKINTDKGEIVSKITITH